MHSKNTVSNVSFDINNPNSIIFAPRNIREVEEYDRKSMENIRQ